MRRGRESSTIITMHPVTDILLVMESPHELNRQGMSGQTVF